MNNLVNDLINRAKKSVKQYNRQQINTLCFALDVGDIVMELRNLQDKGKITKYECLTAYSSIKEIIYLNISEP